VDRLRGARERRRNRQAEADPEDEERTESRASAWSAIADEASPTVAASPNLGPILSTTRIPRNEPTR
jgi:hypothetical protein